MICQDATFNFYEVTILDQIYLDFASFWEQALDSRHSTISYLFRIKNIKHFKKMEINGGRGRQKMPDRTNVFTPKQCTYGYIFAYTNISILKYIKVY